MDVDVAVDAVRIVRSQPDAHSEQLRTKLFSSSKDCTYWVWMWMLLRKKNLRV